MGQLDGKAAIVTGAGRMRGIGRAIAVAFAREGASVTVTGTGRPSESYPQEERQAGWRDIDSVAEEIRAAGARALPLVSDVSDAGQVQEMIQRTAEEFGRVDILVNNAAAARGRDRVPTPELEDELWRRIMEVNLTGMFLCSKYFARQVIREGHGGHILNISSVAGWRGSANIAAYATSKAGMIGFTRCLAMDLAPHGILVNCICPGLTDTYRVEDVVRGFEKNPESIRRLIPLGRVGTPEDVAGLALFLVTSPGSYITGQSINVDGGIVMS